MSGGFRFEIGDRVGQVVSGNRAGTVTQRLYPGPDKDRELLINFDSGGFEWLPERTLVAE